METGHINRFLFTIDSVKKMIIKKQQQSIVYNNKLHTFEKPKKTHTDK